MASKQLAFTQQHWIFILIFVLGAFLRLFRIEDTLLFQGDQGRDAITVSRIFLDGDLTLLGPATSVGNMYLGPFYYYYMLPFLLVSYPSPVGPAIGVAILDMATLALLYVVVKNMFSKTGALFAASLYATMPIILQYARFSWNPNIAGFFSLGIFYTSYRYLKTGKKSFFLYGALLFSLIIQLHYVALLSAVMLGGAFIGRYYLHKTSFREGIITFFQALLIVVLSFTPLFVFDVAHDGLLRESFSEFFGGDQSFFLGLPNFLDIAWDWHGKAVRILAQLPGSSSYSVDQLILGIAFLSGLGSYLKFGKKERVSYGLLLLWILGGIVGTSFYSETVFDHYLVYLFPALAMFYGLGLATLYSLHRVGAYLSIFSLGVVTLWYVSISPGFIDTRSSMHDYRLRAEAMAPHIPEGNYNIALLSSVRDYRGMTYRYFLEAEGRRPERYDLYSGLDYLVVIDELIQGDPLESDIYEIASVEIEKLVYYSDLDPLSQVYIYSVKN